MSGRLAFNVPPEVIKFVGGGPDGGAKPAETWSETLGDNVAVFNKTIPIYDPDHPNLRKDPSAPTELPESGEPIAPTNPLANPPTTNDNLSNTNRRTIIGSAIGGFFGLVVIGGTCYLIYLNVKRRVKNRENDWQKPELNSESLHPPAGRMPHRTYEIQGDGPRNLLP